jgi:hypothetical protein
MPLGDLLLETGITVILVRIVLDMLTEIISGGSLGNKKYEMALVGSRYNGNRIQPVL